MRYLGINLNKEGKDLDNENYKILLKDLDGDIRNLEIYSYMLINRVIISTVKMTIMLKVIYKLNIIPIQIHIMFKESEQKCQDVLTTRHLK